MQSNCIDSCTKPLHKLIKIIYLYTWTHNQLDYVEQCHLVEAYITGQYCNSLAWHTVGP